jgi:hypothetical protein
MCAALLIASSPSPLRGWGCPHCIVAGAAHLGSMFHLKYPVPTVSESVVDCHGDVNAADAQLAAELRGTASWIG